jgi:hypothetical protein
MQQAAFETVPVNEVGIVERRTLRTDARIIMMLHFSH